MLTIMKFKATLTEQKYIWNEVQKVSGLLVQLSELQAPPPPFKDNNSISSVM